MKIADLVEDWPLTNQVLCQPTREQAWGNGKRTELLISHCTNAGNAILLVHGCEFIKLGFYHMIGIAPDEGPSDKDLYDWGKRDVEVHADTEENFPNCLERFLLLYEQMFHQRYVANVEGKPRSLDFLATRQLTRSTQALIRPGLASSTN